MTKRECAIVETYTGICMCAGDDRKYAYEYASELIGRPIYTHEFVELEDKLRELSKPDFIRLCKESTEE